MSIKQIPVRTSWRTTCATRADCPIRQRLSITPNGSALWDGSVVADERVVPLVRCTIVDQHVDAVVDIDLVGSEQWVALPGFGPPSCHNSIRRPAPPHPSSRQCRARSESGRQVLEGGAPGRLSDADITGDVGVGDRGSRTSAKGGVDGGGPKRGRRKRSSRPRNPGTLQFSQAKG
jgi:hypothetical protein